jgi:hypothetical protein
VTSSVEEEFYEEWPTFFQSQVESSPHVQKFIGQVWTHLKRDADQRLSHELLLVRLRAGQKARQTRNALDKLLRLFQMAEEMGLSQIAEETGAAVDIQDLPESRLSEKKVGEWKKLIQSIGDINSRKLCNWRSARSSI